MATCPSCNNLLFKSDNNGHVPPCMAFTWAICQFPRNVLSRMEKYNKIEWSFPPKIWHERCPSKCHPRTSFFSRYNYLVRRYEQEIREVRKRNQSNRLWEPRFPQSVKYIRMRETSQLGSCSTLPLELLPPSSPSVRFVTNWHFSRSFHLIFLNTYDPYLSRSHPINTTMLVSNHFAYSLCSQITRKMCVLNPMHSRHNVCTTTGDPFQNKTKHELYSMRVRPQARSSKTTLPPGSENPPYCSSRN